MPKVTSTRTQYYQNGFVCRNLKTCSITKSPMSFFKQNFVWCEVKANSASLLYFHINSTKIKSKIPYALTGHSKIPYLTELSLLFWKWKIFLCFGILYIIWIKSSPAFQEQEGCDNNKKITQRKVTLQLSPQIWFRLFYRGVKGRLLFFLKSANQNMHAWVKSDPQG